LGLSLIKFGNPVVLDKFVDPPTDGYEWIFDPWPGAVGYWLLAGIVLVGLSRRTDRQGRRTG